MGYYRKARRMCDKGRWYPSKVDLWIAIVLAIAPVVCVISGASVIVTSKGEMGAILTGAAPVVFISAIYLLLVFPMRYGITIDEVIVRFGVFRSRIPFSQITEVVPTHNPLSSPALSLDRLKISCGKGTLKSTMISPAEKDAFLNHLAAAAGLRREGDRLVR